MGSYWLWDRLQLTWQVFWRDSEPECICPSWRSTGSSNRWWIPSTHGPPHGYRNSGCAEDERYTLCPCARRSSSDTCRLKRAGRTSACRCNSPFASSYGQHISRAQTHCHRATSTSRLIFDSRCGHKRCRYQGKSRNPS